MRPDPRLLVPCNVLPFVPDGATIWDEGRAWVASGRRPFASMSLDLSHPDERDGVPARLDALPWALTVLGWIEAPHVTADGDLLVPVRVRHEDERAEPVPNLYNIDLGGLSRDDASRAVVAAALRARGDRC